MAGKDYSERPVDDRLPKLLYHFWDTQNQKDLSIYFAIKRVVTILTLCYRIT